MTSSPSNENPAGAAPGPKSPRKIATLALSLLLATTLWLPVVHLPFRAGQGEHSTQGPLSPRAEAILHRQLHLWEDPAERAATVERMRETNAEWDFMGRTFLVLALGNAALRRPQEAARYLAVMDRVTQETLAIEREKGMYHFLMGYATRRPFVMQPARSVFVDGEIALMLAAREAVVRSAPPGSLPASPELDAELEARLTAARDHMEKGPVLSAESYPDECWTFCNTMALAAMRLTDAVRGDDRHAALARRWVETARARLVDPATGLLVSSYTLDGKPIDGPEGSSIWIAAHALLLVDPVFAREQYELAKRLLGAGVFGFGWAREWPAVSARRQDVDSGPIVPVVDASAGSSGLAFVAASAFGDDAFLSELLTTLDFAAFPVRSGPGLRYAASNQVGDAALLYALSLGPLWSRAQRGGGP